LQPAYITKPIPRLIQFNPEHGGSMFLWYVSICLQDYTVSQCEQSSPWKPQNLCK
jgi:hypothetical protein